MLSIKIILTLYDIPMYNFIEIFIFFIFLFYIKYDIVFLYHKKYIL